MGSSRQGTYFIIVVGAGPAGLQVAHNLSREGHTIAVLNRDVKFGGLAEYGIFPSKHRLRNGLRKSYWEILSHPNLHYYGNVTVGNENHITLEDLRVAGASAVVFATGAQGTKSLRVEGEDALGAYHAKDVVYHFNQLPQYSQRPFDIGQKVAVIGIGDVMVDIAHWLIRYKKIQEVTAIVRRGPAERKYNPKEIRAICDNIDREDLGRELARIGPRLREAGQDPEAILKEMNREFSKCQASISGSRMKFRFLSSPARVLVDSNHRVRGLELEDTKLERKGSDFSCIGLKSIQEFLCDTVIFAVGDRVDSSLGLCTTNGNFSTNPIPTTNDPDDAIFQVHDDPSGKVVEGFFVTGWARKASVGLVGVAKRDGDFCSKVVSRYLATQEPLDTGSVQNRLKALDALLRERQPDVVDWKDIEILTQAEAEEAKQQKLEEFKFATNHEMLAEIRKRKRQLTAAARA